jgi:hypothetical protein
MAICGSKNLPEKTDGFGERLAQALNLAQQSGEQFTRLSADARIGRWQAVACRWQKAARRAE